MTDPFGKITLSRTQLIAGSIKDEAQIMTVDELKEHLAMIQHYAKILEYNRSILTYSIKRHSCK